MRTPACLLVILTALPVWAEDVRVAPAPELFPAITLDRDAGHVTCAAR